MRVGVGSTLGVLGDRSVTREAGFDNRGSRNMIRRPVSPIHPSVCLSPLCRSVSLVSFSAASVPPPLARSNTARLNRSLKSDVTAFIHSVRVQVGAIVNIA